MPSLTATSDFPEREITYRSQRDGTFPEYYLLPRIAYMNFHRGIMFSTRGCTQWLLRIELRAQVPHSTLMIVNAASRLSCKARTMAQIIIYITSK